MKRTAAIVVFLLPLVWPTTGAERGLPLGSRPGYSDIGAGYDFPAPEARLLKYRDFQCVPAMRKHAWDVFAGMTVEKNAKAVWETWYPANEVFDPQKSHPSTVRTFELPLQLESNSEDPVAQEAGRGLLSHVLFNAAARDHIIKERLNLKSHLTEVNAGFGPSTPLKEREIPPFPPDAVVVKTVWRVISKVNKYTSVPVWNPPSQIPKGKSWDYSRWKDCVAVQPDDKPHGPAEIPGVKCNGSTIVAEVHGLKDFHHLHLSAKQAAEIRKTPGLGDDFQSIQAGDAVILVALHFTTKEIGDWVWATLWWHDHPDDPPFGADRTANVRKPWRNYRMDTTLSMDTPSSDLQPRTCFNPWLEGPFTDGPTANCMTCHARAVFPYPTRRQVFVTRGSDSLNDQDFQDKLKLDFLWSLLRAQ